MVLLPVRVATVSVPPLPVSGLGDRDVVGVMVATVSVPPLPMVTSRNAASPVPPTAAFTVIVTALVVVLVVVIELSDAIVKLSSPTPSLLACIVMVPEPASIGVNPFWLLMATFPVVAIAGRLLYSSL